MTRFTINGVSFDPDTQMQALAAAGMAEDGSERSNYILVQVDGPLTADQRAALVDAGAEPLEYVPGDTYVCRYEPADLDPVRSLPFVQWAHVYMDRFKVDPRLLQSAPGAGPAANLLNAGPVETNMSQQPRTVEVVLHRDVDAEQVRARVAEAVRLDPQSIRMVAGKLRVTVQPQMLDRLVRIDEVRHVEEFLRPKLHNAVAISLVGADVAHAQLAYEGQGQVIAVCDTGFDTGSSTNVHPAFTSRVQHIYALGRPATGGDPHGHGTHVAGSVLGDGVSHTMGGAVRGSAPKARLVIQSVLDAEGGLGGLPDDLKDLFRIPYEQHGARVHTNSWGSPQKGRYTQNSYEVDEFVWLHRDLVVLFSAGNEGADLNADGVIDATSIGSPATAKNCLTIGASENLRPNVSRAYGSAWPSDYPAEPVAGDGWADNPNGIAAFSSRGPTRDGRVKPDLVAPGTAILSAHSREASVGSFWGASQDPLYCFMGGTSMATPIAAGCAALVREFLARAGHAAPSAALVKALLINGAQNIPGQYVPPDAGAIPNFAEGFGRIDMQASLRDSDVAWHDESAALDTGEEWSSQVDMAVPNRGIKATLVWTDPPGEALVNDLDLVVSAGGLEWHGNAAPGSVAYDRVNNVEQVVTGSLPAGPVRITVRAHRIALGKQDFALVVRKA